MTFICELTIKNQSSLLDHFHVSMFYFFFVKVKQSNAFHVYHFMSRLELDRSDDVFLGIESPVSEIVGRVNLYFLVLDIRVNGLFNFGVIKDRNVVSLTFFNKSVMGKGFKKYYMASRYSKWQQSTQSYVGLKAVSKNYYFGWNKKLLSYCPLKLRKTSTIDHEGTVGITNFSSNNLTPRLWV